MLLMTVKGNQTVAFFDEATGERLAAPIVGTPTAKPHEIVLSADGRRAFVSLYGDGAYAQNNPNNQIAVVDVASMSLERVIGTDLYRGPHGLARDFVGRIWVTAECNDCVLVIDPEACQIVRTIYAESHPHFLYPSRDRKTIYSAHKETPFLGVHDAEELRMVGKIPLEIGSQAIWHAPDRDVLYVGDFFRPLFHVVDTTARKVVHSVPLQGIPGWPYATPDGRYIVVSTYIEAEDRGFAEIFETESYRSISIVELPAEPFHILACEDGETVLIVVGDGRLVRMNITSGQLDDLIYQGGAAMPEQVVRVPSTVG
jgi:DNA-binding beta-propeller fold protein YncE